MLNLKDKINKQTETDHKYGEKLRVAKWEGCCQGQVEKDEGIKKCKLVDKK